MKPCSENKKLIAWLALNELDASQAQLLRDHLATCPGCQEYQRELLQVTRQLSHAPDHSEVAPSPTFHRRLAQTLQSQENRSLWQIGLAHLKASAFPSRITLAGALGLIAVIVAWSGFVGSPPVSTPIAPLARTAPQPKTPSDPAPTFSHYRMLASQSLDALDEVLTREGERSVTSPATYAVTSLAQANTAD